MKNFLKHCVKSGIVISLVLSLILSCIIESAGRGSLGACLAFIWESPLIFLYNTLIIFVSLTPAILFRRRIFVWLLISSVWLALGITNGAILSFRMTPFTVFDLAMLENGVSILPNYLSTGEIILAAAGALCVLAIYVLTFLFAPRRKDKIPYIKNLLLVGICAVALTAATGAAVTSGLMATYFGNLNYAYRDYGVPYCFINTWVNRGMDQPADYTEERVADILTSLEQDAPEQETYPNIILVQLESFIDPGLLKGLSLSADPIPTFHAMQESCTSGTLVVPSVGAGTANTEFEVLTGMRIRYMGPGEYPYKTILKKTTCESLPYVLRELGYSSHAIHNHRGSFYNRDTIFSQLGFDTFTSVEYMNNVEVTPRNWEKDNVLVSQITAALDSTEGQDMVFTISVQGHGKYPEKARYTQEELAVTVVDGVEDEGQKNALEYYIQQLYEMDLFLADLLATLEEYDEECILVAYGDHLPVLDDLTEDDLKTNSLYKTEYVIWSNSSSVLPQDEDLIAYQLGAVALEKAGISGGVFSSYHQERRHSSGYLEDLKLLQYDMLYGKRYAWGGSNPFVATDIQMGVLEISLSKVLPIGDWVYLRGNNFTPYSKVTFREEILDTIFVNPYLVKVEADQVASLDLEDYGVSQVGKYNTVMSTVKAELSYVE
ncbi:MAG: LTA synthase family protein [Bacillota bacterium]|nr:LTA synthase family protein [Bacillota bacterium]